MLTPAPQAKNFKTMNTTNIEQVKQLANYLSPEDNWHLAEFLNQQAGNVTPRPKPQSLRGNWKDAFPPDLDLNQELKILVANGKEMSSKIELLCCLYKHALLESD